jgi:uncharacterized protein YbjT (DUF2867 family)
LIGNIKLKMGKSALVVGATGLIGGQLLDLLLQSDRYDKVIAITRKSIPKSHNKLVVSVVDFDNLKTNAGLLKADDVFCCLGTTMKVAGSKEAFKKVDYEYPLKVAELCKEQGTQQFLLVSALDANPKSKIFYNQVKGEVEEAISHLQFETFHIFRPSLLLGSREELRIGEKIGQILFSTLGFLFIGSLKKYKGIESIKVARAMLAKSKENEHGQFFHESDQLQKF